MCGQSQRFAAHVRTLAQFRTGTVTTHSNCVLAIVHLAIGSRLRAEPGINNLAPFRENIYLFSSRLSSGGKAPRGVRAYGSYLRAPFQTSGLGLARSMGPGRHGKQDQGLGICIRCLDQQSASRPAARFGCPARMHIPPVRPCVLLLRGMHEEEQLTNKR